MRRVKDQIRLSASDLSRHLGCRRLTQLDLLYAQGKLTLDIYNDPALEILKERGVDHENAYIEHLRTQGRDVIDLRDVDGNTQSLVKTVKAMQDGIDVIVQPELGNDRWHGRADFLIRVERPSKFGAWSYEVSDTKLAQDTRAGTILQLCVYSDLVAELQGIMPEKMYVVKPGNDFKPEEYRLHDFLAYYRLVREQLHKAVDSNSADEVYPYPVDQCRICRWWAHCDTRRRDDDHLCLIAGVSSVQMKELERQAVYTLEQYASEPEPLREKPLRGSTTSYASVHHQAQVQLRGRHEDRPVHDLLPPEEGRGLTRLPKPNPGDIFFDIESDNFVEGGGLEYLFGIWCADADGTLTYTSDWAFDRAAEKRIFETLIDFVMKRWAQYPEMHIYHFAPYEPAALKRLMGRHATRESEMDELLRAERFVDLHAVTRQGVRASVERYSLKPLEAFFGFERDADLREADNARHRVECLLELETPDQITDADRNLVETYNKDDCVATQALRDWLEDQRQALLDDGHTIERPEPKTGEASENLRANEEAIREVFEQLTSDIPENRDEWKDDESARWLLAHQLDYFRRENKVAWWEFYRMHELDVEEMLEERKAVTGLVFQGREDGGSDRCPLHRYTFPPQEVSLKEGTELKEPGGDKIGTVYAVDQVAQTIDVKKTKKTVDEHPDSLFGFDVIPIEPIAGSLLSFGRSVAKHGTDGMGPYRAGRDLLLKRSPRLRSGHVGDLRQEDEGTLPAALRLALDLDDSVLAVQGPPGSGKTYTGSHMIASLLRQGKRVGITAVSHKVIRNLILKTMQAGQESGISVEAVQKKRKPEDDVPDGLEVVTDNNAALNSLNDGKIVGGSAWLWARDDAEEALDYLFVDEAGQMSLAMVLAASRSAKNIILLGDPRQLEQPQQGAHPEGADVAALEHMLDGYKTIPDDRGLFLDRTWRLCPDICAFTSEIFYENRLQSHDNLCRQEVTGETEFAGNGLRYVAVEHSGNRNTSAEEVEVVAAIIESLVQPGVKWVDHEGVARPIRREQDILVVAPYNAHVASLMLRLPEVRIGTVDKFQGQEAPVVLYSMASSSTEDAPRGMSFIHDPSRLNVATSRARCLSILVASPRLLEPECRTVAQMQWANALCRFREMAAVAAVAGVATS